MEILLAIAAVGVILFTLPLLKDLFTKVSVGFLALVSIILIIGCLIFITQTINRNIDLISDYKFELFVLSSIIIAVFFVNYVVANFSDIVEGFLGLGKFIFVSFVFYHLFELIGINRPLFLLPSFLLWLYLHLFMPTLNWEKIGEKSAKAFYSFIKRFTTKH